MLPKNSRAQVVSSLYIEACLLKASGDNSCQFRLMKFAILKDEFSGLSFK